jgi:hypothetical protein
MSPDEIESFERILSWRTDVRNDGACRAGQLLALSADERVDAVEADGQYRTIGVFEALLAAAREELDRNPANALELTKLVEPYVASLEVPQNGETFLLLFRARFWKEYAHALRATGSLQEALVAVQRSLADVGGESAYALERADAELLEAYIRHELDDTAGALRSLASSAAIYTSYGDVRRYLNARTMEAILQFELRQYRPAELTFLAVKAEAERLDDKELLARVLNNLGHCALKQKHLAVATDRFTRALVLFEELRWDSERERAIWGLVSVLGNQGRVDDALDGLFKVRGEFMARGMVLDAAAVALGAVELLVTARRFDMLRVLCADLVTIFTEAGMKANAVRALAYLQEEAASAQLDVSTVRRVHQFVRTLKDDPELTFAA